MDWNVDWIEIIASHWSIWANQNSLPWISHLYNSKSYVLYRCEIQGNESWLAEMDQWEAIIWIQPTTQSTEYGVCLSYKLIPLIVDWLVDWDAITASHWSILANQDSLTWISHLYNSKSYVLYRCEIQGNESWLAEIDQWEAVIWIQPTAQST